jgi:hypothetical protein
MRPIVVTWGKFKLELPAELVLLLVLKLAFLSLYNINV